MNAKTRAVTASVTILLCLAAAAVAEGAAAPAAAPIVGEGTSAAKLIAAIREASDVKTAATNYSQARTMDKDNPELYDTYMKKMLKLGHPKIALYPAMELRRLQAKNGTAWGVIGYSDAKRSRYLLALTSTIRGLQLLPDDPGIQHNAGVLVAWYQTRRLKPRLAPDLKAMLADNSEQWLGKAKYAEAHNKCKSDFAARAKRIEKLKAEIAPAEKAANAADRESRRATTRYKDCARSIDRLRRDTRALEKRLDTTKRNRVAAGPKNWRYYDRLIRRIRTRIRASETKFRSLRRNRDQYRNQAVKKADLFDKAMKILAKAKASLRAEEKAQPSLSWLPPAVDGVITPESKTPPTFAATHAQPASQPSTAPAPEAQLKMARLLLENNRRSKAMAILELILKKHPDTKAAKEAAELLKELKRTGL